MEAQYDAGADQWLRKERVLQGIEAWLQGFDPWDEEEQERINPSDPREPRWNERELYQDSRPLVRAKEPYQPVELHQLQVGDEVLRVNEGRVPDKFRCTHMILEDRSGQIYILAKQA